MKAEKVWDSIWQKQLGDFDNFLEIDEMTVSIYNILLAELGEIEGKTFLEAGSGSGTISLLLSRSRGQVSLLDTSPAALEISRRNFKLAGEEGNYVHGSIFDIPLPEGTFDVVWNAGVLEHFTPAQQSQALQEMLRVCKTGGRVVTLNPYAKAYVYRFAKFVQETLGVWPYGYEMPINSLIGQIPSNGVLLKEYSTGFAMQLNYLYPGKLRKIATFLFSKIQDVGYWLFNGYLLVSVIEKGGRDGCHRI